MKKKDDFYDYDPDKPLEKYLAKAICCHYGCRFSCNFDRIYREAKGEKTNKKLIINCLVGEMYEWLEMAKIIKLRITNKPLTFANIVSWFFLDEFDTSIELFDLQDSKNIEEAELYDKLIDEYAKCRDVRKAMEATGLLD